MIRLAVGLIVPVALCLATVSRLDADTFVLKSGGQLSGTCLNPKESPRKTYLIETATGAQIALRRNQIVKIIAERPALLQYQALRPSYPDTIAGQEALAEWCRAEGLLEQRKSHLGRIIELDPEHAEARRALGYTKSDGRWATQEQRLLDQGYKRYQGRWRTSQEIEQIERAQQVKDAEKDWFVKINRWFKSLGTARTPEALRNIRAISDPYAVKPLVRILDGRRQPSEDERLLIIETLARIGSPHAIKAIAERSLFDDAREVRLTCLDHLAEGSFPDAITYYVNGLRHQENYIVQRSALGLGRMKDPSTVGPLIESLVTTHQFRPAGANQGAMAATFPTDGRSGGGLSMNKTPTIIRKNIANQPALDALIDMTGQNFDFDQRAWRLWYASRKNRITIDGRRDRDGP